MYIFAKGHYPDKLNDEWNMTGPVSAQIYRELESLALNLNIDMGYCDMSPGVGLIWAHVLLNNLIPITAVLAHAEHTKGWPDYAKSIYSDIIHHDLTERITVATGPYHPDKVTCRDRFAICWSDALIAVWDGSCGNTKNAVEYTRSMKKPIHYVNPLNFTNSKNKTHVETNSSSPLIRQNQDTEC